VLDVPPIETLAPDAVEAHIPELGALLHACVLGGASVNFVLPFSRSDAEHFWRTKVLDLARDGRRVVFVARSSGRIVGTVVLDVDTPPNQPHRGEVTKLLVHPAVRRRGIARALMTTLEAAALARGRTLLTLDTRTGDAAEPLYAALGYVTVGIVPGYSRAVEGDGLDSTTIMYKPLRT